MTKRNFLKLFVGLILFSSFFWGEAVLKKVNETEFETSEYKSENIEITKIISTRFKNSDGFYNRVYYSSYNRRGLVSFGKTKAERINHIEKVDFDKNGKAAKLTFQLKNKSNEVIEVDIE